MKKLRNFLVAFVLVGVVFSLTGCGKEKEKEEPKKEETKKEEKVESKFDINNYKKEVKEFELQDTGKKAKLVVKYAKDAGFKDEIVSGYRLILKNGNDNPKVQVEFYHTNLEKSLAVHKYEEKDFDAGKIKDYKKFNVTDGEGWGVYRLNSTTKKIMSYEAQFFFGKPDEKNLTNAVKVTVTVNSTTDEGKNFDFEKYVNSDDFQYLLYTLAVKE